VPTIERQIVVEAPPDTVYQVWRNVENFPTLMSNIEEVRDIGNGRSHWRAKGPLGRDGEWDAEITRDEPGREIAWRSIDAEESNVQTSGRVQFQMRGDATLLKVALTYETPAGAVGSAVAKIFANPDRLVEEDLVSFKEKMEQGGQYGRATERTAGHDGQVRGKRSRSGDGHEAPEGPGTPSEPHRGRPTTTSTPGGTLGAPTESDLKRDQEEISERTDTRSS